MSKKNLAVIFGSRTCEHEVSIITAIQFIENADKEKYNIIPIYITNTGIWYTGDALLKYGTYKYFEKNLTKLTEVTLPPNPNIKGLITLSNKIFSKPKTIPIDVAVISVHGMNGEDGTIQGLLELANIPYVSSGVLGSSVGMDKILMKSVFKSHSLPILNYEYFLRNDWYDDKEKILNSLENSISYPMFIKPANLGSSIGISKAKNRDELIKGIEIAIGYDKRIIVEQGINELIEINCAALGFDKFVEASVCEQPISWEEFLTFDDKYLKGINKKCGGKLSSSKSSTGNMNLMDRKIPAEIPSDLSKQIQELTISAFKSLNCSGTARVDFIIDKNTMTPYINEINTIPGAFSYYIWEYNDNYPYPKLIDKLIDIAVKVHMEKNKNIFTFNSNILSNLNNNKLGKKLS